MRIAPLVLLALLVSCTKNIDKTASPQSLAVDQQPQACNFGLTSFNKVKRPMSPEAYAKAKIPGNNVVTTPPPATIYLDFDGENVTNTAWRPNGTIECAPANLQATEIEKIVARVKEDYAPFNVTITTDEAVYLATNQYKRMRVIITESW